MQTNTWLKGSTQSYHYYPIALLLVFFIIFLAAPINSENKCSHPERIFLYPYLLYDSVPFAVSMYDFQFHGVS